MTAVLDLWKDSTKNAKQTKVKACLFKNQALRERSEKLMFRTETETCWFDRYVNY